MYFINFRYLQLKGLKENSEIFEYLACLSNHFREEHGMAENKSTKKIIKHEYQRF